MDGMEKKISFDVRLRQKLYTTLKKIAAAAPKLPPNDSAIITVFGIFGILVFFLIPCSGLYMIYRTVEASYRQENATYQYQTLSFDYVCTRRSANNARFTTHCASDTRRGGPHLTTLRCDVSSVMLDDFLLLQDDGKCVVAKAQVANKTGVVWGAYELNSTIHHMVTSYAPSLLCFVFICCFFGFVGAVDAFTYYRHLTLSSPPLSAEALRIHSLTAKWRNYFRCAVVFSFSVLVFDGAIFLLLAAHSFDITFTSLLLVLVAALPTLFPLVYSVLLSVETNSAYSLSDSVVEASVIIPEEPERIRRELEEQRWQELTKREDTGRERRVLLEFDLD